MISSSKDFEQEEHNTEKNLDSTECKDNSVVTRLGRAKLPLTQHIIQHTLFGYVPKEAAALAAAFQGCYAIPEYRRSLDKALKELLQYTAKGEAKAADAAAKLNYLLILEQGEFIEEWCGQRKWKRISPLQYAAWAGDRDLVKNFLSILPPELPELKREALLQLEEVKEKGTEHGEPLAAISKLVAVYKEYEKKFKDWSARQRKSYCIREIGKSQLNSVVNLLQWYCRKTPFDPIKELPDYNQPLNRSLILANENKLDLSASTQLGSFCYLYRGASDEPAEKLAEFNWPVFLRLDRQAVEHFCEVRKKDLSRQIDQLKAALQKEELPKPVGLGEKQLKLQ